MCVGGRTTSKRSEKKKMNEWIKRSMNNVFFHCWCALDSMRHNCAQIFVWIAVGVCFVCVRMRTRSIEWSFSLNRSHLIKDNRETKGKNNDHRNQKCEYEPVNEWIFYLQFECAQIKCMRTTHPLRKTHAQERDSEIWRAKE